MTRRTAAACLVAGVVGIAAFGSSSTALAARAGSIHPGVQTFIAGGQCTANFVFRDAAGTYVGLAAHCAGTGAQSQTNGCTAATLALGTPVAVTGAAKPGVLVYSSWVTMQIDKETDPDTCAFNDFALVKIDPADIGSVNPSVPGFGGPSGVGAAATGATVFSYGNSSLRMGVAALSPKQGVVVKVTGAGWGRSVLTLTPGIPGDSGSGFLNAGGRAIGVLSTLSLAPLPLTNGIGDLSRELTYMRAHSTFSGVQLVNGTTPFRANLLRAINRGLHATGDRGAAPPITSPSAAAPTTGAPAMSRGSRVGHPCRRRPRAHRPRRRAQRPTTPHRSRRASTARSKRHCARAPRSPR